MGRRTSSSRTPGCDEASLPEDGCSDLRSMLDATCPACSCLAAALPPMLRGRLGRLIAIASGRLKGYAYVSATARQAWSSAHAALALETAKTSVTSTPSAPATRSADAGAGRRNIMRKTGARAPSRGRTEAASAGPFRSAEEVAQTVLWLCAPAPVRTVSGDLHVGARYGMNPARKIVLVLRNRGSLIQGRARVPPPRSGGVRWGPWDACISSLRRDPHLNLPHCVGEEP